MKKNQTIFDFFNVFIYIQNNFFYVHHVYESHRSTDDRKRQTLNIIEKHWNAKSRTKFVNKNHDQIKMMIQIAKKMSMSLTYQQTQTIVRHRLKNSSREININAKIMIKNWKIIANQLIETKMISQSRTMKIFFYAPSFFFQLSKRICHQISVFFTSQTDHKNLFVFFSVMFFSFVASSSSTFQS